VHICKSGVGVTAKKAGIRGEPRETSEGPKKSACGWPGSSAVRRRPSGHLGRGWVVRATTQCSLRTRAALGAAKLRATTPLPLHSCPQSSRHSTYSWQARPGLASEARAGKQGQGWQGHDVPAPGPAASRDAAPRCCRGTHPQGPCTSVVYSSLLLSRLAPAC